MTTAVTVSARNFAGLDLQPGDTLRVLSVTDLAVVVQVRRLVVARNRSEGKASVWLRAAKGSVRLTPGETADDARMAHLRGKHALGV